MSMEISADLINQLRLSLRKEAKLSSFDPVGDDSFPRLPTSEEAIAELDASAPYLRCRNCKGKLLRGIESLICVFCGEQQRTTDNPPDPIKFTSTCAYKWFLSSLHLDGSEIVEPLKETNGSSRGAKAPVVKEIAVSKFLDLDIQWSAREEKSSSSGPDNGQTVQNKNPLNLGGVNLDDFFVEGRGDLSKVVQAESKPIEDDDFKDPRSLSLFDSVKSPAVGGSQQHENVGFLEKNDADKSVSSEEHKNLSLFAGRDAQESGSLAEQGNFGFFEGKDAQHSYKEDENLSLFEGKDTQRTSSSKNDERFGFFDGKNDKRNSSSKEDESLGLFEGKESQQTNSSIDDESFGSFEGKEAQRNSSSKEDENLGLFKGAPSSNAGLKSFNDKNVPSSSDWNSGFQSVDRNLSQEKIDGDPFVNSPVDLTAHMDSVFGSGKDLLYAKPADFSTAYVTKAGDWAQDDLFGNVACEAQKIDPAFHDKNEKQVVSGNESSSMDIDWIGDDLWQTSEKKSFEKTPIYVHDDDHDDGDDWNDFASSANSKTPDKPLSQTMERSQDEIFDKQAQVKNGVTEQSIDEKQITGTSVMSDVGKGQEDDLFETWDSSTSLTIPQTSLQSPTNHVNLVSEKNLEMNLFEEKNNHIDLDFDSISRSDFFSESIGGKTNSEEVRTTPSGTSTLERTKDPDGKDDQRNNSSTNDERFGFFDGKGDQRNSFPKQDENIGLFKGKDAQRTNSSKDDESFGLFKGEDAQRNSSSKEDENLASFESAPSSNAGLKSFGDNIVASSSDWIPDFQSADHNLSQKKIGGDPFVSSPVNLAAHMDSVFGSGKDFLYAEPADSSTAYVSKAGDWLQEDLFGNVASESQNNDLAVHDKNEGQIVGDNGNSSMDIDWIGEDLWQTSGKKSIEKTPTDINDDDDDWNEFASSANSKTPNNTLSQTMESSQVEIDGQAQVKNGVKEQSVDEKLNTGTSVMSAYVSKAGDWLQDDLFSNVAGESLNNDSAVHDKNDGQVVGGNGSSSMDIDWIGENLWQTIGKKSIEKTPTDVNDDDDDWNDFASSADSKIPNNSLSQTIECSQDEIFDGQAQVKNVVRERIVDEKQNTGTSVMSDVAKGQEDDLFGAWGNFTSSTIPQTSPQPPTSHGNPSGGKKIRK